MKRCRDDVVKSAGRALQLLEMFSEVQRPMRMSEIARGLDSPQSSTSVLVRSLVSMGYLIQNTEDRTFAPSLRVTLLGSWLNDRAFQRGNLARLIRDISAHTGDSVILATRNRTTVEVLDFVQGREDPLHHTKPGEARVLTRAFLGHMILSVLERCEAELLVRRVNAEQTRESRRVPFSTIEPVLDQIRRDGYGYCESEQFRGSAICAFVLPRSHDSEILVIGDTGPLERIRARKERILETLHELTRASLRGSVSSFSRPDPGLSAPHRSGSSHH